MSDDFLNDPEYSMKNSTVSTAWIWGIAVIFIMILAGFMFFTKSVEAPPNPKVSECKSNIQRLGDALLAYTRKNNGIIPGATIKGKPYWQFLQNEVESSNLDSSGKSPLKCYSDTSDDQTSYLLNESLAGRSLDAIPSSEYSKTALLYERPTHKYHRWAFYLDGVVRQYNK